jgi:uncharacterized membrane protein
MAVWGLIVAAGLAIGSSVRGLSVALPILGHATGHLFSKVVEPASARQR